MLVVVRYRPLNHEFRDCIKISRIAEKRMGMAGGNAIFTDLDDAKYASPSLQSFSLSILSSVSLVNGFLHR